MQLTQTLYLSVININTIKPIKIPNVRKRNNIIYAGLHDQTCYLKTISAF